jgi:hypothetical protein
MYEEDMYYPVVNKKKKTNKYNSVSVSPIPIHALYEEDYSHTVKAS